MVSEKQITLCSSSAGPSGPGFALLCPRPLEDDVVLSVTSATVPNKGFGSQTPTIVSVAKRIQEEWKILEKDLPECPVFHSSFLLQVEFLEEMLLPMNSKRLSGERFVVMEVMKIALYQQRM